MTTIHAAPSAPPGVRMLDHVALRVSDRDACAAELLERLDIEIIDRTDSFTLLGPDFTSGKITLLDAVEGTEPEPVKVVSLVFAAGAGRPAAAPIVLDCGLVLTFHAEDDDAGASAAVPRHALVGVVLRSDDPPISAALLAAEFGLQSTSIGADVASLAFGTDPAHGRLTLVRERGRSGDVARTPMLDHVGVRIADAGAWRAHAERVGLRVDRWVEAPRTNAVFIEGPDSLLVEYVEHLPTVEDA